MPDTKLQPHPDQPKPPPPRDFGKASWRDVGAEALRNAGTSAANFALGTPFGLAGAAYHAARQGLGYEPTQPGFNRLAIRGVTDPYMLSDINQTGQQIRNWAGKNFGTPELAMQTAKRTFAGDPVGTLGTLAGGANLLSHGAEALSHAPVVRSTPILRAPVRGVGAVAGALGNPVGTTVRAIRGPGPLLPDGSLHPNVATTMDRVAKGSAAEMQVNPAFRDQVVSTMQRKGVTDEAAREAILKHHLPQGASIPRSATTGLTPQPSPPAAPGRAALPTPADIDQATSRAALKASGQQIAQGPGLAVPSKFGVDPATGKMTGETQAARDATVAPATAGAFNSTEASNARLAAHAQDILTAPTSPDTKVKWGPAVRQAIGAAGGLGLGAALAATSAPAFLGEAAGHLGGAALDLGVGALTGTGAGLGEGKFIEPLMSRWEAQEAKWGAPGKGGPWVSAAGRTAPVLDPAIGAIGASQLAMKHPAAAAAAPKEEDDTSGIPDAYKPGQGVADTTPPTGPLVAPMPQPAPAPAPAAAAPTPAPAAAPTPAPAPEPKPAAAPRSHDVQLIHDDGIADAWKPPTSAAPAPQAAGGRVERADGGHVTGMVDQLMGRAEREGKATRSATKPLLGLDDTTVAKALAIAGRAI